MRKSFDRIFSLTLCLVLLLSAVCFQASAAEPIDPAQPAGLTLSYVHEDTVLAGAAFDIYRVAAVSGYGDFAVAETFADYPLDFTDMSQSRWAALANTMMGLVQRDDVKPTASGTTDAAGNLSFEGLETGLYLVLGTQVTVGNFVYTAVPFFVCIPTEDMENNVWNYSPVVFPKSTVEELPPIEEKITQKVLKQWDDKGYENKRPEKITVDLLCDGKVYDTVELSKANNWAYTWTDLEKDHTWTVAEKTVEGYTVTLTKTGVTFMLTNKIKPTTPPGPKPPTPLPQTGLLWWPVPILLGAGILCVLIAILRKKSAGHDRKE